MHRLAIVGLSFLLCCSRGSTRRINEEPAPTCGDGVLQANEACEGSDLNGQTCQGLGFDEGQLVCGDDCTLVTTACVRRCGNGQLDPAERCDGDAGRPACDTFGVVSCDACMIDVSTCVLPGLAVGPVLDLTMGGPAVIGDLPPAGPGDLVVVVPSLSRVESYPFSMGAFNSSGNRKYDFGASPVAAVVSQLDSASGADLAVLNADGTLDGYFAAGQGFMRRQLLDGGCAGGRLVGAEGSSVALACAGHLALVDAQRAVTSSPWDGGVAVAADFDGDGELDLGWAHEQRFSWRKGPALTVEASDVLLSSPSALAAADFDGDGDLDLAASTSQGVALFENTGALGWASKGLIGATQPEGLWAGDLDLDRRPDLVYFAGGAVVVRRNQAAWSFAEHSVSVAAGRFVSLAVGDAEGDGDADVIVVLGQSGQAVKVALVVNRVR